MLNAPIISLVEAKNDNINNGFGQCIAEMIAAQFFNKKENKDIKTIFGVITTGSNWRFLKLENKTVFIENKDIFIEDTEKILTTLLEMVH